jgi:hypothetical protein
MVAKGVILMPTQGFWMNVNGKWVHILGDKQWSDEDIAMVEKLVKAALEMQYEPKEETGTSLDIVDYSAECSMCGKPMPYRFCGMCTTCEMVWNS